MKEITPNIFVIQQAIGSRKYKFPVNMFVIAGVNGIVFDSGYGTKKCMAHISSSINEISKLMEDRGMACSINNAMTSHGHWDHFSGLRNLQKNCGLQILATQKQLPKIASKTKYLESISAVGSTDSLLYNFCTRILNRLHIPLLSIQFVSNQVKIINENDTLTVDDHIWQILHLPGHDNDDICLYNEDQGILLAGDLILRSVTTWLGPPKSDLDAYIKSLASLLKLPHLKLILPAHGSPIEKPRERIEEAIDHRRKRTEQVLDLVLEAGNKGIVFEDLFRRFYPRAKFYQRRVLSGWILVTLQYLIRKGAVHCENNTSPPIYSTGKKSIDIRQVLNQLIQ